MRIRLLTFPLIVLEASILLLAGCASNVAHPTVTPSLVADLSSPPKTATIASTSPTTNSLTSTEIPTSTPFPGCQEAEVTTEFGTYTNTAIGFSIDYPSWVDLTVEKESEWGLIGDKVWFQVADQNPLDCQGDCPVIMLVEQDVTVAEMEATRIQGYIGSIGGSVPQEYIEYIFDGGGYYYVFILYARCQYDDRFAPDNGIWPVEEEDIAVFDQMMATLQFEN